MTKHHHGHQPHNSRWRVDLALADDEEGTIATADVFVDDAIYEAHGHARNEPGLSSGEKLAVARALSSLAHQLLDDVSREVELAARAVAERAEETKTAYADADL